MSWEENTNEMMAAANAERKRVEQQMAEYKAQKNAERYANAQREANRLIRQSNMTPRQKVLNNITNRRIKNQNKLRQQVKLNRLNRKLRERMLENAEAEYTARSAAGSKISNFLVRKTAKQGIRNLAARPPGTMGPNNTGGELYKLWKSKAANRWPKTRKARKSRRRRN